MSEPAPFITPKNGRRKRKKRAKRPPKNANERRARLFLSTSQPKGGPKKTKAQRSAMMKKYHRIRRGEET